MVGSSKVARVTVGELAGCEAAVVLGKELRRYPDRARRELRARAAAAALVQPVLREPGALLTLEAPLRGQDQAGSDIVVAELAALGVAREHVVQRCASRSTREEALLAKNLADSLGIARLLVLTSAYHARRAGHIFSEVLGPERVCCATPEAVWAALAEQRAELAERVEERIRAGVPGPRGQWEEARAELLFGAMARLLRPLPRRWRWGLEMGAAVVLRGLS